MSAARLVTFAALCAFGALHWAALVADAPIGRVLAVVAIATAGGGALGMTARLRVWSRLAQVALRLGIVVVTSAAAMVAVGLPARFLRPRNWDVLAEGVERGLAALRTVVWPYAGGDGWVALTILLGIPLFAAPAAALAFWPARRRTASALRLAALAVLLTLYGVPVTEYAFAVELQRGLLLFALVAAWLWLPGLAPRDGVTAALAVLGAGLAALPVAAALEGRGAWVDYQSWQWFGGGAGGAVFDWRHGYGPISWPRGGTTLLWVKSDAPHYWKVESLDRFDGLRWLHSGQPTPGDADGRPAERFVPRWNESIGVTLRSLRTSRVVGAGLTYRVFSDSNALATGDGPTYTLDPPLRPGDSYDVRAYVPEPGARELRAAPTSYDPGFDWYTRLEVPVDRARLDSLAARPPVAGRSELVDPGVRTAAPIFASAVERAERRSAARRARRGRARLLASPYRRVYRRARRFTRGGASPYVVARRIERYLTSDRFEYSERSPRRRYPLAAFLLDDRSGYCQHFSGAMALMLRMSGIPARVAAGFAPGRLNQATGEYRVRDLDAHSWVEVYFPDLGWVAFDPTPSAAPAATQTADREDRSAAGGGADAAVAPGATKSLLEAQTESGGALGRLDQQRSRGWLVGAALVAVPALGVLALWLRALVLRRRRAGVGDPELRELESALDRLGYGLPEETTLLELERRLAHAAGPPAARYARRLRQRRYAPGGGPAPDRRERRALRRSLTSRSGPLGRARGFLALPPHGFHAPPASSERPRRRV